MRKTFTCWDDVDINSDHGVVIDCVWYQVGLAFWVEFTISLPGVGPQGTQLDALIQGSVTHGGSGWQTIGEIDNADVPASLVGSAVARAIQECKAMLRKYP